MERGNGGRREMGELPSMPKVNISREGLRKEARGEGGSLEDGRMKM